MCIIFKSAKDVAKVVSATSSEGILVYWDDDDDLSADFDTIDHNILITSLSSSNCIHGSVRCLLVQILLIISLLSYEMW